MSHIASQLPGEGESRHRVIVVDDNEILLRAWKKILHRAGYECFATTNPEAALEEIERSGADLLISDIVMPHMDGFELIQRIQQIAHSSSTSPPRIVLTTGYVCDFKRLRLDVGTQDIHVLLKPYNSIQEVLHFVQRVLGDDETLLDEEEDSTQTLDDARVHLWSL
jgi:CheY-like chemotaxis protein